MKGENNQTAEKVSKVNISDEMEDSYISYAMSVIVKRALPDVRDGLKPVQRRILYSMYENKITHNKSHRKCSNIVGDTMGDYHPHGDKSIYDALARMAQDFSMGEVLIDGQGNFGSIDGDSPAAMRYTEARLSKLGEDLVEDIDKDTVEWSNTYDGRKEEPDVLPARFPNLLVNGSSGIAVGMSTNIPPHNLGEVIDATIHYMNNKDCEVADLLEHIKGPDFPTGGEIVQSESLRKAYTEGKGKVTIRPNYRMEDDKIVITEIPFKKNKSKLVKNIADLVNEGEIEGIRDLRDQSDSDGVEIVVELKNNAINEVVEKKLLDKVLEVKSFSIRNIALVGNEPRKLTLKEILKEFVEHRKDVVRRRVKDEYNNKKNKVKVLNAKLVAIDNADDFINIIRESKDRKAAKKKIVDNYDLDEDQAESVVRMQLGSLTSLEMNELSDKKEKLETRISRLETILQEDEELENIIIEELEKIKENNDTERKTNLITDYQEVEEEDLIPEEDIIIMLTENNYIKRLDKDEFRKQHRTGKGVNGIRFKNGDTSNQIVHGTTHDLFGLITNKGNIYTIKGYEIPVKSRTSQGTPMIRVIESLDDDEKVETIDNINNIKDKDYLIQVTEKGRVKKTDAEEYYNIYDSGIRGINKEEDDKVVDQFLIDEGDSIMMASKEGKVINFDEKEVRSTGRSSMGVTGMRECEVVSAIPLNGHDEDVLFVKDNGIGKRTKSEEFSNQARGGKGSIGIKVNDCNLVEICKVQENDSLIVLSKEGNILRTDPYEISRTSRNTKGVKIMDLDNGDKVTDIKCG